MSQKTTAEALIKLFAIIILLPFVLIWYIWAKTNWNNKTKGITTTILVFFYLIVVFSGSPEPQKTAQENASPVASQKSAQQEATPSEVANNSLPAATEASKTEESRKMYKVSHVVDGDTVAIEIDGKEEVLRLIGINTPETVDPRKPVQCFGVEASNKAKETLTGKKVSIEADDTQDNLDKYNRPLRYVYLEDGTNFNKLMIAEGYAYEYTYNTPYKYQSDFKEAERKAMGGKKGLWAESTCNGNLTKSNSATTQTTTPETKPATQNTGSFNGSCAGKRTCGQMTGCQEAYFYLNSCGVGSLDRDKDGIPCETLCN